MYLLLLGHIPSIVFAFIVGISKLWQTNGSDNDGWEGKYAVLSAVFRLHYLYPSVCLDLVTAASNDSDDGRE